MGETIEAWLTESANHATSGGVGPYSRKIYMDAGTLSGDGKRVAVFRNQQLVGKRRLRVEIVVVVGRRRLDISARGSLDFVRRKRRGGHVRTVHKWSSGAWSSIVNLPILCKAA